VQGSAQALDACARSYALQETLAEGNKLIDECTASFQDVKVRVARVHHTTGRGSRAVVAAVQQHQEAGTPVLGACACKVLQR